MNEIVIRGAREHNLKNIDVELPKNRLIVFTGLSGSGKSSLAFDTVFAEGQRRYVESLSSYARQFLGRLRKPDVESIEGLSPAISIDQKTRSQNPRSTVGTVTEIYDYLRVLFARIGVPHCPRCGREIRSVALDSIVASVLALKDGTRFSVLAPVARGRKGEHGKLFEKLRGEGFVRVKVDGETRLLEEEIALDRNKKHDISVVVDRLIMKPNIRARLAESVETSLRLADGLAIVENIDAGMEELYSTNNACAECGIAIGELSPRLFSFNAPAGACPACDGLGHKSEIDIDKLIPDRSLSLNAGAIKCTGWFLASASSMRRKYRALAKRFGFSLNAPYRELPDDAKTMLLYGASGEKIEYSVAGAHYSVKYAGEFEGVVNNLARRYRETASDSTRSEIEKLMTERVCPACGGRRLRQSALGVTIGGKNISEVCEIPIGRLRAFFDSIELSERDRLIAEPVLKEIGSRLDFLNGVGLSYLTLSRPSLTLSGGESQRIRLATQIGSGLTGVLYILDEPSIGLHARDNRLLIDSLKNLRDLGNTLIVVEHDYDTIRAADYIVDIGPMAGARGGEIVCKGSLSDILSCPNSLTGEYLSGRRRIEPPPRRRVGNGHALKVIGASEHNLKRIDAEFPLGKFIVVTGVSGSGKSSLVNGILYPRVANALHRTRLAEGACVDVVGTRHIDKAINIDQSPIGRTPRSNPATYTGVFSHIRELFASAPDAKARGYKPGRFSFNVKGGRCENCAGDGIIKIEMHFLPDVYVPCEVCGGKRYNAETLDARYKGKNIYEVLEMTVDEAAEFFAPIPSIAKKLDVLRDVGLGYIRLGQPATTFSGGEAQRIKLAAELGKRGTGRTLYVLDEPTTGLHPHDISKLIAILNRLVDRGNTVIAIEHNLDVIRQADHIIDLGPEGGAGGGRVVATGTPEEIKELGLGYTSIYI